MFDLAAFAATPLQREPFDHLIVPGFIRKEALAALNRDFPAIEGPSNHPPERLDYGPAFARFLDSLRSPELAALYGEKFGVDLSGCHPTIAIRRYCEATDGNIHTDHKSKVITVLFYFNEHWPHAGGRLRLVRSPTDIEDYAAESVPEGGAMLALPPHRPLLARPQALRRRAPHPAAELHQGRRRRPPGQLADQADPPPARQELRAAAPPGLTLHRRTGVLLSPEPRARARRP